MKRLQVLLVVLVVLVLALSSSVFAQDDANTLVFAINADTQGYNAFAQTSVTNLVTSFMWPTLIQTDPQTGELLPNLASWTVSEDGLTYTFNIEPDAVWSDGLPITAQDVKFTLEASQSPVVGSFMAGQYNWSAINVIDDKTLEIVLPAVDCTFLGNLGWGIMPAHKFAADFTDFNTAAINTAPDIGGGPFIFDEHAPDEFIRLRANPNYWKGQPAIDNIVFQIIPDNEVAFQSLMGGAVDIAAITADQDPAASSNPDLTIFRFALNTVAFTTFNLADHGKRGKSLAEDDLVPEAQAILAAFPGRVPVPVDAVCAKEFSATATPTLKAIENVEADDMILDIGPQSIAFLKTVIAKAGTIVWNGPVGVFEFEAFAGGTRALADAIVESKAFTIAGGGDTVAAINKFGIADKISYISTAGGAFLEFLEGKTLPAVAMLETRARS